eukprot:scaffold2124_cov155-Skeletonema_dohrnii-CCMP3373.AAC.1
MSPCIMARRRSPETAQDFKLPVTNCLCSSLTAYAPCFLSAASPMHPDDVSVQILIHVVTLQLLRVIFITYGTYCRESLFRSNSSRI